MNITDVLIRYRSDCAFIQSKTKSNLLKTVKKERANEKVSAL